jgi:hypothetical protein
MQKLNPESMNLEIGGGKFIPVNEHSVWCAFQIPRRGCDPPSMTDEEARIRKNKMGQQICQLLMTSMVLGSQTPWRVSRAGG